jgi:opacity protein-like surface antigen
MKVCTRLVLVFALFGHQGAKAEDPGADRRWSLAGALGWNWVRDREIDRTTTVGTGSPFKLETEASWDSSGTFLAAVGYAPTAALRLELELARRSNDLDQLTVPGGFATQAQGDVAATSVMANALYVFASDKPVRAYIGAGLGAARISFEISDTLSSASADDWAFAAQGIVGVSWAFAAEWEVFGQYQYFWVPSADVSATTARGTSSNRYELDDYQSQTVSLGIRYRF